MDQHATPLAVLYTSNTFSGENKVLLSFNGSVSNTDLPG
jgi:hypothetical protein